MNVIKKIWRFLYPVALYLAITIAVAFIAFMILYIIAIVRLPINETIFDAAYHTIEAYTEHVLLLTLIGAVSALPLLYWFFQNDKKKRGSPAFFATSTKQMGYAALLGICMSICINNLIELSAIDTFFTGYDAVGENLFSPPLCLQIIAIGLVVPIAEEFTFRGLCFLRLREHMSFGGAAVISSLLFGVFHGNVVQGIYAFVMGLLMAWCYERFRSLLAPILYHCSANLASVIITSTPLGILFFHPLGFFITTVLSLVLGVLLIRHIRKETVINMDTTLP